jgi:D-glycero-alpha-D-manno-heptose-7-phosphate kinase
MIVSRSPYRLSLFGGGTDYPAWFENNPSRVLTAAMARYSYISLRKTPSFVDYKYLVNYSEIEKTLDVESIKHPSAKACIKHYSNQPVQIVYDGDLPARSGIGSSSTFTVGLILALITLDDKIYTRKELAEAAIRLEQEIINESVGIQDQIAAAYGGILDISMGPKNHWIVDRVELSNDVIQELEKHILLGYSNISRLSETQAKKKIDNIKEGKSVKELQEITDITNEAIYTLNNDTNISSIGKLLDKSWNLKKRLAEGVSSEWMDSLYSVGIKHGAYGGKLMGAGGGGFFYFIAPPERHESIRQALSNIKFWVPFKFDFGGSKIILK